MALTTGAAAAVAKPHHHHLLYPKIKPFNLKPTATWSCSSSGVTAASSSKWVCMTKRRILEMSMGVLAAAAGGALMMPSDADATRIEYYATVSEPPCNFNFARSGLAYCDIALGTGDEPPLGQLIVIHYTARFADGTVFDSSYKRARPLTLRIGVGKVIKGLDQGIIGGEGVPPMLAGGKRKIQIPPQLAYGPEPAGCFSGDCNIPANATLIYDINYIGPYK